MSERDGWERRVPPIALRQSYVDEAMTALVHPSGDKLHQYLKQRVWWSGMWVDCQRAAAASLPRAKENAQFRSPPYLIPTPKGREPFQIVAVDTIVALKPAAPDGATSVILCVDTCSRFVLAGRLANLDSYHTATWFNDQVVGVFGMPAVVRSDRGPEYRGAFDRYLREAGVEHRLISTMHPRANGIVERQVRSVKAGLRRFFAACPGGRWWEALADVVRGLNVIPVRATGLSPYTVVFKAPPRLAVCSEVQLAANAAQEGVEPPSEELAAEVGHWQLALDDIVERQSRYDAKMIREYARRAKLADFDVRFLFRPGDRVLLKQKTPGKQQVRALGPFVFCSYTGALRVTATIADGSGRTQVVSVANLLPLRAGTAVAVDDPPAAEEEDYPQPPPAEEVSEDEDFGVGAPRLDMRGRTIPRSQAAPPSPSISLSSAAPVEPSGEEGTAPRDGGSSEDPTAAAESGEPPPVAPDSAVQPAE